VLKSLTAVDHTIRNSIRPQKGLLLSNICGIITFQCCGSALVSCESGSGSGIQGFDDKNLGKFTSDILILIYLLFCNPFASIKDIPAIEERLSALKRDLSALQNIKFLHFFHFLGHISPPGS
jgi:hypothetical protein